MPWPLCSATILFHFHTHFAKAVAHLMAVIFIHISFYFIDIHYHLINFNHFSVSSPIDFDGLLDTIHSHQSKMSDSYNVLALQFSGIRQFL